MPYRVRWQDLKDLFRKAGTVLRADVSLGPDNRSRGYGTVLLATAEDATRAVEMFHGYNWQTRTLEVRPDRIAQDFDGPNPILASPGGFHSPGNSVLFSHLVSHSCPRCVHHRTLVSGPPAPLCPHSSHQPRRLLESVATSNRYGQQKFVCGKREHFLPFPLDTSNPFPSFPSIANGKI